MMSRRRSPDRPPRVSIVHPWDPWHKGVGGFDTFLDGFLRHVPAEWHLELIGTTGERERRPVGRWLKAEYAGRPISFLPVLAESAPNRVSAIPLSLRFVLALRRFHPSPSGDVVVFHRFESRLGVRVDMGAQKQVFYLHNHPDELSSSRSGSRWNGFGPLHHLALMRTLRQADIVVAVDPRTPGWIEERMPGFHGSIISQR
jgi:hypothetical protein